MHLNRKSETPSLTLSSRRPVAHAWTQFSSPHQVKRRSDCQTRNLPEYKRSCSMDLAGPLIWVLKATEDDPDHPGIMMEAAKTAVVDAVKLLGNVLAQKSRVRRRKLLKAVNPKIQDLANEDTPNLFELVFEFKMKERVDSMKLLQVSRPPPSTSKRFFQGGHPTFPWRGSSQNCG